MKRLFLDLISSNSTLSSMRVMSLVSLLAAIGIALYGMNKPAIDYSGLTMLVATFLSAAFGGKVAQKSIEMRAPVKAPEVENVNVEVKP
jgi:hypothetical protein